MYIIKYQWIYTYIYILQTKCHEMSMNSKKTIVPSRAAWISSTFNRIMFLLQRQDSILGLAWKVSDEGTQSYQALQAQLKQWSFLVRPCSGWVIMPSLVCQSLLPSREVYLIKGSISLTPLHFPRDSKWNFWSHSTDSFLRPSSPQFESPNLRTTVTTSQYHCCGTSWSKPFRQVWLLLPLTWPKV